MGWLSDLFGKKQKTYSEIDEQIMAELRKRHADMPPKALDGMIKDFIETLEVNGEDKELSLKFLRDERNARKS